jgi:hypothetical protein
MYHLDFRTENTNMIGSVPGPSASPLQRFFFLKQVKNGLSFSLNKKGIVWPVK